MALALLERQWVRIGCRVRVCDILSRVGHQPLWAALSSVSSLQGSLICLYLRQLSWNNSVSRGIVFSCLTLFSADCSDASTAIGIIFALYGVMVLTGLFDLLDLGRDCLLSIFDKFVLLPELVQLFFGHIVLHSLSASHFDVCSIHFGTFGTTMCPK